MVGALKRLLGIDLLEGEVRALQGANAARVEEVLVLNDRLSKFIIGTKELTSEPAKPKIVPKPQRTSWKQFRSAAEKASDPEREEA